MQLYVFTFYFWISLLNCVFLNVGIFNVIDTDLVFTLSLAALALHI